MLDMCKSLDLNTINGRKTGDLFGNYTCLKCNGNSVVDYLLTSAPLFQQISFFKVGTFLPWLSDHCPIYFTLDLRGKVAKTNIAPLRKQAPKQFMWSDMGIQKFLKIIKTTEFQNKLETSLQLDYTQPNDIVNYISDVLIKAAEKAEIKTKRQNRKEEDPPWFNNPCRKLK